MYSLTCGSEPFPQHDNLTRAMAVPVCRLDGLQLNASAGGMGVGRTPSLNYSRCGAHPYLYAQGHAIKQKTTRMGRSCC
ncbi:hypothetical protein MASSI9I_60101 [Massilia sp. 9I]|nr:hypothetical protein MASSI9I_60101 [Massilia sp. 9I]